MKVPEKFRITEGPMASDKSYGCCGAFEIPLLSKNNEQYMYVIASNEYGWDHVSVTRSDGKMPTWYDMCLIKGLFWDTDETVVQFHPKASEYVNHHPRCLHLWRDQSMDYPLPPKKLLA